MPHEVYKRDTVKVAPPIYIFSLDRDILWNIFMLNADMDASTSPDLPYSSTRGTRQFVFSPLTVLRCSSQVCQSWRAIILEAPSLWSRVIDLDVLQISSVKWMDEVMKRTGQAPLHVKGRVSERRDPNLFERIISSFGDRIRSLDIVGEPDSHSIISFLQNPAPCLESFKLQIKNIIGHPNLDLFANNAPSLRSYFHTGILFKIEPPLLSNLRNLYLCSHIGLGRLHEMLSRTPRLEFLKIDRDVLDKGWSESPLRHVTLIHLKEINIYDQLLPSAILLDSLVPATGCRLSLRTPDHSNAQSEIINVDMLTMIEGVFSRYTQTYFTSNTPRQISLEIGHDAVNLSARIHPTQNGICPDFVLSAICREGVSQEFLQAVLSPFLSCDVKCVTHLDLDLVLPQSFTNLKKLLNSLTNVHKLHTTPRTLQILSEYPRPVFPLVHTISFRYFIPGTASTKAIYRFMSLRRKFGASAIRTLDFTRTHVPESCFLPFIKRLPTVEVLPKRGGVRNEGSEDMDI